LKAIQRQSGVAAILVTHDQEEAFDLGDRIGVMNFGRLIEVGTPQELYQYPKTEYVASFLGSANLLLGHINEKKIFIGDHAFPIPQDTADLNNNRRAQILFRPEDVAIAGDGFFQVSMPDGSTKYTRDGALMRGPNGELMTSKGNYITPSITIPTDATAVSIGPDGGVNVINASGTQSVIGTLTLARFANPSGLSSEGDNLLAETKASGTPITGTPGENGFGTLQGGFLEKSNVQMITELVSLITAQRAYETSSRAIRAGDEMLRKAIQIARF